MKYKNHKVPISVFDSISTRLIIRKFGWKAHEAIIELCNTKEYQRFGSQKLQKKLWEKHEIRMACSTIDKIRRQEGSPRRPSWRRRDKTYGRFERALSLNLLQINYKTWLSSIHSIQVLDNHSWCILAYHVSDRQLADDVIKLIQNVVDQYGKPREILSDYGSEFYSVIGGKGRSKLDKWCMKNRIQHTMGRVHHPQMQGKIERSHETTVKELENFDSMKTVEEAKEIVVRWVPQRRSPSSGDRHGVSDPQVLSRSDRY